ncbi:noelin-2b isoform X2 [Carassius gibelio]|uniref:noelin-2b isoform X2 n=1 Tax=Carassius gibelio TaxID=101364 RepID=UPI0022783190|nr:noelin-2b isoform X2 [Carassius gibelio]
MSAALLKVGAVLSTMIMVTNWMSQTLPGLVGLDPHIARPGTSEKIISVSYPGEDEGWQVYGSVQGKCVCSIMTPAHSVCGGDPRHTRLQLISDQLLNVSQHMEILSQRTTQDLQRLRDSETLLQTLERRLNTAHEETHRLSSTSLQVWVMDGYFKGRRLVEYQSLGDFATGQNFIVHHLPHPWAGTGHVVYNGSLYYNKHHSNVVVRYDLASGGVLQQRPLAQAGFNNTFPYSWGGSSDIDLMADEMGLWAVYSSIGRGGNMLLSRLDPDSLEVLHSWDTGFSKRSAGESFLICGSLYVTNSHLAGAKVHFTFHTASASYEYTDIAFHNQYSHISMLDYNPRVRALYTWNNGHQVLYDITLLHFIRTRHANSTD